MNPTHKKMYIFIVAGVLLMSTNVIAMNISEKSTDSGLIQMVDLDDLDPNTDLHVTVSIKEIRALDDFEKIGDPDFYVRIYICDNVFESEVWPDQKYLYGDPYLFQATQNIPDYMENVSIKIQLWDKQPLKDRLCDLDDNYGYFTQNKDVEIVYNTKMGTWDGEDFNYPHSIYADDSGYGRLNGCDDNSYYENDLDCELLFDVTQSDTDGDGIPYWIEVNKYGTDPMVDDTGRDDDGDGVPIEWEYKWGTFIDYNWRNDTYEKVIFYNPFEFEQHNMSDIDDDGLNNVEEYLVSEWNSDPFRKDIFIELDQMEAGTNGEPASVFPNASKELIKNAFNRRNIVYHFDDGCMGGGETIPFIEPFSMRDDPNETVDILYNDYFLHGNKSNWRKGVFFYSSVIYDGGWQGYNYGNGSFLVSLRIINEQQKFALALWGEDNVLASVYMHEHGHALGLNELYGHDLDSYYPWQIKYWRYRPYKSCMNYGYTYILVDFSDGSHGKNDRDDWDTIDLTLFEQNRK